MDYSPHWATLCKCSSCGEIPEVAPMYHCPFQHQYCFKCFNELRRNYRGSIEEGCTCTICKVSGKFQQSKINTDFLRKLKIKPGIGRPCRYNTNYSSSSFIKNPKSGDYHPTFEVEATPNMTVEALFQLPTQEIHKLLNKKSKFNLNEPESFGDYAAQPPNCEYTMRPTKDLIETTEQLNSLQLMKSSSNIMTSKKPLKCPHNSCKKMVATSAFVSHFKHEHTDIPKYNVERGKELCIPCDVSVIEHDTDFCIAMITVYEINKIDVVKSKSSQSVIKTCNKFCQKIPINTFWLMVSGSVDKKAYCSYALYWLFTSSEELYQCTIELSSKCDATSVSTFCSVNSSHKSSEDFINIAASLNCLLLSKSSLISLLREGPELNLRVTIH